MYAVTVTFRLHPGQGTAFLPLVTANARASVDEEPGCVQFDVCTDGSDPDTVFLYEVYTSRAAFDAHRDTAHFEHFDRAAADMIAAKSVDTYGTVIQ